MYINPLNAYPFNGFLLNGGSIEAAVSTVSAACSSVASICTITSISSTVTVSSSQNSLATVHAFLDVSAEAICSSVADIVCVVPVSCAIEMSCVSTGGLYGSVSVETSVTSACNCSVESNVINYLLVNVLANSSASGIAFYMYNDGVPLNIKNWDASAGIETTTWDTELPIVDNIITLER